MFGFITRPWAIHNPLKSWTLVGLSLRECQLLVASMSDAEMKISWAFHKKWTEWKPLSGDECHSLFLLQDHEVHIVPSLPELYHNEDHDHDITRVQTSSEAPKFKDAASRRFTRYSARIPVQILVGTHTFSTHTADLSEGGFYFEDSLPEWVAGYFTVALVAPDVPLEFTCFLAEDQKKQKFRTEIAPSTSERELEKLRSWLLEQKFPEAPAT